MDVDNEVHRGLMAAVLIAFAALGCFVTLLFIRVENLEQQPLKPLSYTVSEAQAISSSADRLPSFLSPLAAENSSGVTVSMLDNNLNNDGAPDGIIDPLVVVGFMPPLAAANKSEVTVGVLDQDLDNDGNPDGLSDPLVVVAVLSVLTPLVSGSLLLALYELPKLSSIWLPILKRPG